MNAPLLSVVVPAYNEVATVEASIRRVVGAALPVELEIIAVDDGSTDGTGALLERLLGLGLCHTVIHHPRRLGKGAAVRAGIARTSGTVVVVHDADLEYDPVDLAAMLALIAADRADAVCGTRFGSGARTVHFFWRSLANRGLTALSNACTNLNLSDVNCGYKVVRGDVVRGLPLQARGFSIEVELVACLASRQLRVWEVPVSYTGRRNRDGRLTRWWHVPQQVAAILGCLIRPNRS